MNPNRYDIRDGANTTADGTVRSSSAFTIFAGLPRTHEGDPLDCPACGEPGVIGCVMPRLPDQHEGKQCALSDDLCICICACAPAPRLIADQFTDFQLAPGSCAA